MKINRKKSTFLLTGAFCSLSIPIWADLSEVPGEGIYFAKGKTTIFETEKYQDFLLDRNGKSKENFKIAQLQNDVFICPKDGPQIPIQLSGYELLDEDTLKTGINSRVIVYITPNIKMTLGEKTAIHFYKINKKYFFKVIAGNVRINSSEDSLDSRYFVESEEFISEISKGDFVISASKSEGSSLIVVSGSLFTCLQSDISISTKINPNEIYSLLKNKEPKNARTNIIHQNFIEDKLNFEFEVSNQGSTINALLNRMKSAPQGLLTRLSLTNLTEKDSIQLYDEITQFLMQGNSNLTFSRYEAQAIAKLITQLKSIEKIEAAIPKSKFDVERDEALKGKQMQMEEKAKNLKELEDKLFQEAKEAEEKARAIK